MKILMAASEMVPYIKTGGLGDVLGALPKTLAARGHEVVVCLPYYRSLTVPVADVRRFPEDIAIPVGDRTYSARVYEVRQPRNKLNVWLIRCDHFFGRDSLYIDPDTGADYADNDERFIFFTRAVFEAPSQAMFLPDILHVHDWQTALAPVYLKQLHRTRALYVDTKSVLTIHNLAHQGTFPPERYPLIGLSPDLMRPGEPFEFYGKINLLKAGIVHADKITTVSPRYAREITTEPFGAGLHGVLQGRSNDLVGILNGVDYTVWSPSRDRRIPYRYHINNLGGKRKTRVELMNAIGLPIRERVPLIGVISRLAHQKGFDLMAAAAERLFQMDIQMVVLGVGDEKYHRLFDELQQRYPDKLKCFFRLDEDLAHMIEAGSDIFLMPSLFEPCGLNQIYSLKYGTVPLVHAVGGLADTIVDFDPDTGEGTGFVFDQATPEALIDTVARAIAVFQKKRAWTRLMKNGMQQDYSWARVVGKYEELYRELLGSRS
jgi:starch synthase